MKKLESILVEDGEGNKNEISRSDYLKAIVSEMKVKDYESEHVGKISAKEVVNNIIVSVEKGTDVPDELQTDYAAVIERVTADVKGTIGALESAKEQAAAEKEQKKKEREEEKARKEKEKAELAARQEGFVKTVAEGADKAADNFVNEMENLKKSLPKGVKIGHTGQGYGILLDENVDDATLGLSIGLLYQTGMNSEFLANQTQFMIGDLAGACVNRKLFPTALDASKKISDHLVSVGKRIAPGVIDTYRRMSERTPIEMRNPRVDPTAYLEISKVKRPKKGENESKEHFEARVAKFDEGIAQLQKELAEGTIVARKDIIPKVREFKYDVGLEERPDPNAVNFSVSDYLRIYFLTGLCIDKLCGNYRDKDGKVVKNQVCLLDGESKVWITKDELKEKRAEAEAHLTNIFCDGKNHEIKDMLRGYKQETQKVPVGTDPKTNKAITEEQVVDVPVYLNVFWPRPAEAKEETEG